MSLTSLLRKRHERYVAAEKRRKSKTPEQQPMSVEKTGQLYKIPRIAAEGAVGIGASWAAECVTWPRYLDGEFKLKNRTGDSMLEMTVEENRALQIVVLRCQVRREEYGAAHQFNWKKIGLSRAYFKKDRVSEGNMPTPRAAAAYRFLMAENKFYEVFWQMQGRILANKMSLNLSSYDLFIVQNGIECAMYPHLYPTTDFTDTGILQHYKHITGDDTNRICSIGLSWTRKVLSSVRVYGEQRDLAFFLYEKHMAMKFFNAHVRAKRMGVTGDVMVRDSQASTGYWEIIQDSLADLVRIMLARCYDEQNYPDLYKHVRGLRGQVWLAAFPNLFITISPAEWKFPRPYFLQPYLHCVFGSAYIMALHMYYLVRCIWFFLASCFGHKYFVVYEWVMKTEYQGRATPHWHIAAWIVCDFIMRLLTSRTGSAVVSLFGRFLEKVFQCEIDVQVGNGRLNYINGYLAKDHDSVDVGLGEYVQKESTASWLAAFRLLCKSSPGIPEVAIRLAQFSEFERSYTHVLLYPPQPVAMVEYDGRQGNFSAKMYGMYLEEKRLLIGTGEPVTESFLQWHRSREYDPLKQTLVFRGGRHNQARTPTMVVACRYWYELTDGFWGQFVLTQVPHLYARDLLPRDDTKYLVSMQNFVGMLGYLSTWRWHSPGHVKASGDIVFKESSLPLIVDDAGVVQRLSEYVEGGAVFASERAGFEYIMSLAKRDLQYRGMRDDRLSSFHWKQEGNFLLYQRVRNCQDEVEYERLRQCWDTLNRPKHRDLKWSAKQEEVLAKIEQGTSYEDEETKLASHRWLYVNGAPGSGKSAVILEAAIRLAKRGLRVLIVCPTGMLVHLYKALLPEFDGVENIQVDTIQGVLNYKRPGKDGQVRWAPPSVLRRIDCTLTDEASQYNDKDWSRFFSSIKEQPHSPYNAVIADYQQLQPIGSGGLCRSFCDCMETVTLDTVYRTCDEQHLLFQNRIRFEQPSRGVLQEYFGQRHWKGASMDQCVKYGMEIAKETDKPFTWLTTNNEGASEVSESALRYLGVTASELDAGYLCDPATKSDLRVVAKPGVLIRLSRNLDKQRGFVNGALATVSESLRGNAIFVAKLVGTGNMVLVHPMEEEGAVFLPCCYGYATTIRRAQGASLDHGCIYFDQHKFAAGRGFGYVAVSRFKSRAGCHLYGKLRRTDFLPVGEEKESEILKREYDSASSNDEDGKGLEFAFPSTSDDDSDAGVVGQERHCVDADFL